MRVHEDVVHEVTHEVINGGIKIKENIPEYEFNKRKDARILKKLNKRRKHRKSIRGIN